jgi:hypothetical protein
VAGRTGIVTLTTSDISLFTTAASVAAPVQSVAGRTGAITLTTSDISLFTTAARNSAPVQSINSQTGVVSIVAGSNVTISSSGGSVVINSSGGGGGGGGAGLPGQEGSGTRVLGTDGTSASWVTRYSVVNDVVVAGSGVSLSKNTEAGTITFQSLQQPSIVFSYLFG